MLAIRIAKAHKTTSCVASTLLGKILPLDLRVRETAELHKIKRGMPLDIHLDRPIESKVSMFNLPSPPKRKPLSFKDVYKEEDLKELGRDIPQLFTDGSKIEGKVGAAVVCYENGREKFNSKFKLDNHCSVFHAELAAILRAVDLTIRKKTV
ncbi:unnamed protein product [Parnassius mnemosyne]|uniref:RNase H type-1 domain-containing protein n=1 Tax=Parnassius mnemosyne TaxID=213953 RepID=A0AAV1LTJ8_9NEOP